MPTRGRHRRDPGHDEPHRLQCALRLAGRGTGRDHVIAHNHQDPAAPCRQAAQRIARTVQRSRQVGGPGPRIEAGLINHPTTRDEQPADEHIASPGAQSGSSGPGESVRRVIPTLSNGPASRRDGHQHDWVAHPAGGRVHRQRQQITQRAAQAELAMLLVPDDHGAHRVGVLGSGPGWREPRRGGSRPGRERRLRCQRRPALRAEQTSRGVAAGTARSRHQVGHGITQDGEHLPMPAVMLPHLKPPAAGCGEGGELSRRR